MLVGVEKGESLAIGGFSEVYRGRWGSRDIVIKSGKALQATPNDPIVRKVCDLRSGIQILSSNSFVRSNSSGKLSRGKPLSTNVS